MFCGRRPLLLMPAERGRMSAGLPAEWSARSSIFVTPTPGYVLTTVACRRSSGTT